MQSPISPIRLLLSSVGDEMQEDIETILVIRDGNAYAKHLTHIYNDYLNETNGLGLTVDYFAFHVARRRPTRREATSASNSFRDYCRSQCHIRPLFSTPFKVRCPKTPAGNQRSCNLTRPLNATVPAMGHKKWDVNLAGLGAHAPVC